MYTMQCPSLDILNSDWHDFRTPDLPDDRLEHAGWLERLVEHWSYTLPGSPNEETIARFRALRSLLWDITERVLQEQPLTDADIAALNAFMDAAPSRQHLVRSDERYQLHEKPMTNDWNWILGEVARSFASLLAQNPSRLKQCGNPECRWFYYDESANGTRVWCEEACANLVRVRRFRAKRRAQ